MLLKQEAGSSQMKLLPCDVSEPPVLPSISCLAPCASDGLQLCALCGPEPERRLGFHNCIYLSFCEVFWNFLGACLGACLGALVLMDLRSQEKPPGLQQKCMYWVFFFAGA